MLTSKNKFVMVDFDIGTHLVYRTGERPRGCSAGMISDQTPEREVLSSFEPRSGGVLAGSKYHRLGLKGLLVRFGNTNQDKRVLLTVTNNVDLLIPGWCYPPKLKVL
jgi:hypothetical protein